MNQHRRKYRPGSRIPGTSYTATRFLGSGAMGAVYEVVHAELDKIFVMKVLHHDLTMLADPVLRMRSECRLLARIEHPNIVKVTDAGMIEEKVPFFVMERLEGETLGQCMAQEMSWGVQDVVLLAIELLNGLAAAHAKGIVHRDIKPSNIFITRDSRVKILDFGIAKSMGVNAIVTAKGITLGTPRYMAPEQAIGESADARADLYALGIVMHELLAGEHPFAHAMTPVEMLIAQAGWRAPRLPLTRLEGVADLGLIVAKLLTKDRNARPASATVVRDWLSTISQSLLARGVQSRFRTGEPVAAERDASRRAARRSSVDVHPRRGLFRWSSQRTNAAPVVRTMASRRFRHAWAWAGLVALLAAAGTAYLQLRNSRSPSNERDRVANGNSEHASPSTSSPPSAIIEPSFPFELWHIEACRRQPYNAALRDYRPCY